MVWSRIWEGPEKDDGKSPMSKAAGGMVYLKGGYLGLFGGYARPSGPLQPGSKWTPNPYETVKGWTNEFHLFSINERTWLTPMIKGQRPPPCSDFALSGISGSRAVLFGGYQHNGLQEELYVVDFDPIKLKVTFTLKEKTKPWPEGRECHTSCCIGLDTDHPQMLVSGGKNMRDIALKFDMWMLDLKTLLWRNVKLPPGTKRSPRWGHSMTTVITYPGLESVIVIGGSPAEFGAKWTTPAFPKLMEMLTYNFGNHASEWLLLDEEIHQTVTSPFPQLMEYTMDARFSIKSFFSLEKAHDIPLLSKLTESNKSFQLEIKENQPDIISAISKWLHRSSSKKREPTWENLLFVLRSINLGSLANQVENFIKHSADQNIEDLIATTFHLGKDLQTTCNSMLDLGEGLKNKIDNIVSHTEYTIKMMRWKYEKDIEMLRRELKGIRDSNDDVVEIDGPGKKRKAGAKVESSMKASTVKVETMDEDTPRPRVSQSHERVKELEHQLEALQEHSDSTIRLLRKKNQRLMESIQSISTPESFPDLSKTESREDVEVAEFKSNGRNFKLQGVDVCGETSFVVTNSAQVYTWKGYGLKLSVQDGSLPEGCELCTINVKASLSGQYQFPEDCQLVSAIFWLQCEPVYKFEKPVTVEMEHCANLNNDTHLCFVRAKCNQEETRPYIFKKIGHGGSFARDKRFGTINLEGFSGIGTCYNTSESPKNAANSVTTVDPREYCARIFHFNEGDYTSYNIDFVVTWNIAAKLSAVLKEYAGKNAKLGLEQLIEFDSDSITIDIPVKGIKIEEGWRILPLYRPVVQKKTVDEYKEGTVIPKCQFSAIFVGHDRDSIPPLQHQTTLVGAKYPKDVITFNINPPAIVPASRKRTLSESDATPSVKRPRREIQKQFRSLDLPESSSSYYYGDNTELECGSGSPNTGFNFITVNNSGALPQQLDCKLDWVLDAENHGVSKHLGRIADSITEWEGRIAEELELSDADIESIKQKHQSNLALQKREALKLWKVKKGCDATYNNLIKVFECANCPEYAEVTKRQICQL